MADEVSVANQGNLLIAATLNRLIYELTTDKVDLRGLAWFVDDPSGSGSVAVKIGQTNFDDVMTAPAESGAVGNTALGNGTATVTVARQAINYATSDLFQLASMGPDVDRLAAGGAMAGVRRAAGLIMTAAAGFSNTAGTSNTELTVDDILSGQFQLIEADVSGAISTVLDPHQFTELQSSMTGLGGPAQYRMDSQEFSRMKDHGYMGNWNAIDFWVSSQVTDDGTDYYGAMWAMGGIAGAEMSPRVLQGRIPASAFFAAAIDGSPIWVEFDRTGTSGLTNVTANLYTGYSLNEDAKGVAIISVL